MVKNGLFLVNSCKKCKKKQFFEAKKQKRQKYGVEPFYRGTECLLNERRSKRSSGTFRTNPKRQKSYKKAPKTFVNKNSQTFLNSSNPLHLVQIQIFPYKELQIREIIVCTINIKNIIIYSTKFIQQISYILTNKKDKKK